MEENTAREGKSLGEIFRVIFAQKWLALILAVVVTAVCALGLYFGYNKSKKVYAVSFELELAGSYNAEQFTHKFPDGTTFNYRNIISKENIENVKNSSDAYAKIDAKGLAGGGAISISRNITQLTEASYETVYTLTAAADKFPNANVARDFLSALAAMPDKYLASMDIDYNVFLTTAQSALDYRTEIGDLLKQVKYLSDQYDALIEMYGDVALDGGRTLAFYKQKIASYVEDKKVLANLLTVAEEGLYLKNENLKEKYRFDVSQLEIEYTKANNTLQNLLSNDDTSGSASNATVIKQQSDLVEDLKRDKDLLNKYINEGKSGEAIPESFIASLAEAHSTVEAFTEEYKQTSTAVYGKSSSVTFTSSNVLSVSGGMSILKIMIISLALGIIVALVAAYVAGICLKKKPAKKGKAAPQEAGQTEELQTDDN